MIYSDSKIRDSTSSADNSDHDTFATAHGGVVNVNRDDSLFFYHWSNQAAGATCVVRALYYDENDEYRASSDAITLTTVNPAKDSKTRSQLEPLLNLGYPKLRLFIDSISAGSVELFLVRDNND